MNNLPPLESYSTDEIARARTWPAIDRYLQILEKTPTSPSHELRLSRHRAWLEAAIATFFDRRSAREVCWSWSKSAADIIHRAWVQAGCDQARYVLFALGKLGSDELNLSSDVDLIIVRGDDENLALSAVREFQSLLTEYTDFGFCLRTDFTLRPGGSNAPLIASQSEFEYHYGYHGEMWERLAYVRSHALEGPSDLVKSLTDFTSKFSFRKHLDFTLLDELKALREKIRSEKFEKRTHSFHLKLGAGGIRELELFVHALQVIHGGRNTSLRTRSTSEALERIRELGLLPKDECLFLYESYWKMRRIENRMHAFEDQQNYLIDELALPPCLSAADVDDIKYTMSRVAQVTASLFGAPAEQGRRRDLAEQTDWLKDLGFSSSSIIDIWPQLLEATALSRKSERDESARQRFLIEFVDKLASSGVDRDLGLALLLDFVKATRAKASFFTLLNREPAIRDRLASLFSKSPYLGSLLSSRPELLDEFILRKQADPSPEFDLLLEELAERHLLSELISAADFLEDFDLNKLCFNLSENADSITQLLLTRIVEEYGPADISLMPLGKWGGRELGLKSDLDFIFVAHSESANDHKIARRFLSRITEPHRGGSIYSVDMRLRPSGQSGPILVVQDELKTYLQTKAAAWERQAYLRSRPSSHLGFHPAQVASERGLSSEDLAELKMIRGKLFHEQREGEIDLKLAYGGLADIEFTAQIALLERREFSLDPSTLGMIQYLESVDAAWKSIGPTIRETYVSLRKVEQLFQLTSSLTGSKMRTKSDEFSRLARLQHIESSQLEREIGAHLESSRNALSAVNIVDRSGT